MTIGPAPGGLSSGGGEGGSAGSTPDPGRSGPPGAADPAICPYLQSSDGPWRSALPAKDHVCGAATTPGPVPLETQRRLCLDRAHPTCEVLLARNARRVATGLPVPVRPVARTGPVVLERGRAAISLPAFADRRVVGQAGLVVLMLAALGVLLVARGSPPVVDRAGGPSSGASPIVISPAPSVVPTPTPTPTASSPSPSPPPTAVPSPTAGRPSPSPKPAVRTTYTVRAGDTLWSIASRFGTTVDRIKALNGLGSSSVIHVGEVLRIR
jgi:hypothetical protein